MCHHPYAPSNFVSLELGRCRGVERPLWAVVFIEVIINFGKFYLDVWYCICIALNFCDVVNWISGIGHQFAEQHTKLPSEFPNIYNTTCTNLSCQWHSYIPMSVSHIILRQQRGMTNFCSTCSGFGSECITITLTIVHPFDITSLLLLLLLSLLFSIIIIILIITS